MDGFGFSIEYNGLDADRHEIEFYDVAQALAGFQRSIALTTHLVLNGKVITQAPALKGAMILALPPQAGSWKFDSRVVLAATALYTVGTAEKSTPIGHLVSSAYDYVVSETMGFHVNYEESLGQSYEKLKTSQQNELPILEQSQLDSVVEKTEASVLAMHRPIIWSQTATTGIVKFTSAGFTSPVSPELNSSTYSYIAETQESEHEEKLVGRVSSYNMNTYKGRIFVRNFMRPIAFELKDSARDVASIILITDSLRMNARNRFDDAADIEVTGFQLTSKSGQLKKLNLTSVGKVTPQGW